MAPHSKASCCQPLGGLRRHALGSSWVWLWAQSALLIAQLQASGGAQDSQIAQSTPEVPPRSSAPVTTSPSSERSLFDVSTFRPSSSLGGGETAELQLSDQESRLCPQPHPATTHASGGVSARATIVTVGAHAAAHRVGRPRRLRLRQPPAQPRAEEEGALHRGVQLDPRADEEQEASSL